MFLCFWKQWFCAKHFVKTFLLLPFYGWFPPKIPCVMCALQLLYFIFQNSSEISLSDLGILWLNNFLWFAYQSLNIFSQMPLQTLVLQFSSIRVMFTWYKMLLLRHIWIRQQSTLLTQLQVPLPVVEDESSIFLLCEFIIDFIFGMQL